jgi:hypothetical protein
MRTLICLIAAGAVSLLAQTGPAPAKGCIKGALVGGVAGHYAHHTFLGAAAGCVAGRSLANRKAAQTSGQGTTNPKQINQQGPDREDMANPP